MSRLLGEGRWPGVAIQSPGAALDVRARPVLPARRATRAVAKVAPHTLRPGSRPGAQAVLEQELGWRH